MEDLDYVLQTIDPWLNKYIDRGVEALSLEEAGAVGVWLLDAEVNNGGFDQYYFNTRGVLAKQTVLFLRHIGAVETATLLEAANQDVVTLPLSLDREARIAQLEEISSHSRFRALEGEYYEEREDRIGLLAAHFASPRDAA